MNKYKAKDWVDFVIIRYRMSLEWTRLPEYMYYNGSPEVAKYPEIVLLYSLSGITHKLYPSLTQISDTIKVVKQCTIKP